MLRHWAIEISHGRNQKRNISIKYLNRYPKNIYGSRKSFNRKDCVNAFDKIWVKEIKSHYFQWQPEVTDDNFMPLVHSTNDISIIPENFKFSLETEDLNQTKWFQRVFSIAHCLKNIALFTLSSFIPFLKTCVIDQLLVFRVSVYTDYIIGLLLWNIKQTKVLSKLVCTRVI